MTATAAFRIDPTVASECPSQPPSSKCCDDRLSPPRFPPAIIQYAVWLYFRFTLSLRDVEEMLAQRGIEISYETIRCWTIKFGLCRAVTNQAIGAPAFC